MVSKFLSSKMKKEIIEQTKIVNDIQTTINFDNLFWLEFPLKTFLLQFEN
jgi:hypothetical protein